jgi:hypothetical protein
LITLEDLLKLVKLEKVLFSKLKIKKNLRKVVLLKFKKDKIVNKINKFSNLLLEFLILFESKTILCCSCNIIARFKLALTKFKDLLIVLIVFNCLEEDKD